MGRKSSTPKSQMSSEFDETSSFDADSNAYDSIAVAVIDAYNQIHVYSLYYVEKFQSLSLHGQILTLLISWLFINILLINVAWRIYGQKICDPTTAGS